MNLPSGNIKKRKRREEERKKRPKESNRTSSPSRGKPAEKEFRRDPLKTKRDLEKDRENYVKKKEQKLISKVVDSGLVPPGMETEVNLNEIESTSKEKDSKKNSPKREERQNMRDRSRERRRRRSKSFEKVSSRGRSSERRRDRSRERRRDRSRSRNKNWNARSKERMREPSPLQGQSFRRRRSRSLSNRERWLTSSLRVSVSPDRKYNSRDKDKAAEARKSFLEEIKMKLGDPKPTAHYHHNQPQPRPPYIPPMQNNIYPTPSIPIPAPSNQYYPPNQQQQQHSPYDQNFFIGNPEPININHNNMVSPTPVLPPQHLVAGVVNASQQMAPQFVNLLQPVKPVPPPNPNKQIVMPSLTDSGMRNISQLMEQIKASANQKSNQISAANQQINRKISLTDFLSFHSSPAFSSDPEALQKKVGVLSRCQDVLKELTGEKKFGGKLIVTKTNKCEKIQEKTNVSPLLRKEPPTFSFTSPNSNVRSTFQSVLNKALIRTGVISSEVIELDEDDDESKHVKMAAAPQVQTGARQKNAATKFLMKMCQTDAVKCEECEERKGKEFKSIGIQCGETDRYNVGVQVVEADIVNANLPKNQSLAYLTPAQLLGRAETTSAKVENFGRGHQYYGGDFDFRERQQRGGYGDVDFRLHDIRRGQDYNDIYDVNVGMRDATRYPRF